MRALQPSENCLGAFGVVDSSSAAVVSHLPGASGNQERKFSPCKRPGNLYGIATVVDRLTQSRSANFVIATVVDRLTQSRSANFVMPTPRQTKWDNDGYKWHGLRSMVAHISGRSDAICKCPVID